LLPAGALEAVAEADGAAGREADVLRGHAFSRMMRQGTVRPRLPPSSRTASSA
jgi:hypothetical protein